jgi:putative ABC transport system permease protein
MDSAATRVVVFDRTAAERYFPGENAVGQHILLGGSTNRSTWEVIGVVGAVKTGRLDDAPTPTLYLPHGQFTDGTMVVTMRTTGDAARFASAAREIVRAFDPDVPVFRVRTMSEVVSTSPALFNRRYPMQLIGAFALATLLLAAVGLYGVVSYSVAQRTREIGIRMALGARPADITGLVVREGGTLALIGVALGVFVALGSARLVSALLYGVSASDAASYVGGAVVLAAVGMLASWIPARRAAGTDPAIAIRSD